MPNVNFDADLDDDLRTRLLDDIDHLDKDDFHKTGTSDSQPKPLMVDPTSSKVKGKAREVEPQLEVDSNASLKRKLESSLASEVQEPSTRLEKVMRKVSPYNISAHAQI